MLLLRQLSVHACGKDEGDTGAKVVIGESLAHTTKDFFSTNRVAYLVHNTPGCFNCLVSRV